MKHRVFQVPIWSVSLHIYVGKDPVAARVKAKDLFDEWDEEDRFEALASWNGSEFGLFFSPRPSLELVAHEVFHITHRILERAEANFDPEHHEQGAYLMGWLMDVVWRATRG